MNALDLLIADHNRIRGLFARFNAAKDADDTRTMVTLAGKIFDELAVHTTIEEEIFYPEVRDATEAVAETVDEGLQEHHVVEVLVHELGQIYGGSDEWVAKMAVLIENVEHHAEEEERELFPALRRRLAVELDEMAAALDARKAELGAPILADKIDLSKDQLLDLARDQQIPGRSSMSHEELAATVAPA
ncbi:MAG: hemerythrin domain-containing protein [Microthrixaceae bacterium]